MSSDKSHSYIYHLSTLP